MAFSIELRSEDVLIRWLGDIPLALRRYLPDGLKRGGELMVRTAQRLTEQEDAIGASRDYYEGWRFDMEGVRDDGAVGFFWNDADHAYFAEHGRAPGKMPPESPEFLAWMDSVGIPRRASFVIRRAIGEDGTIKRKGGKGFEIMAQTDDSVREDVLDELDHALTRAIRSVG
jgi:hypothetical protein